MESKKDIRKRVLVKRNSITRESWEEKSHSIYKQVVTHPFFLESEIIYCYIDYQNEVGTRKIIEKAWESGKKVAIPKVESDNMRFYEIQDFAELETGYKGILEPNSGRVVEANEGLIIVPGVAFDKARNRIGYGKGFYDKYLSRFSKLKTLAIAFEMQMVEHVPAEENDRRPTILITEEQIYV